jgi:hypothetical protein
MDPLTGESNVPALQFDNPNPNGNPYVKWDGYQQLPDGTTELIDAKTAISLPFSTGNGPFVPESTLEQLANKSDALEENPGYSGVIEVPTDQVAADTQAVLNDLNINNIGVRVRPFQDATGVVPDAATTDATAPLDTADPILGADLGNTDLSSPGATDTTSATSFPNTGNLIGAGLLGGGGLGNLMSPSSHTDPTTLGILDTTPLFSATYGVNPDGSLATLSTRALVSPGDGLITPPQPTTPAPANITTPASPPPTPGPADTAPASPPPSTPVDTAPVIPPPLPDPVDVTPPPSPQPPAPVDTTPVIPPPPDPTINSDPTISSDPTSDLGNDPSAIDGGGDGAMADMATMDASC